MKTPFCMAQINFWKNTKCSLYLYASLDREAEYLVITLVYVFIATDKRGYPHNIFLMSRLKHMLWVLIRSASLSRLKHMLWVLIRSASPRRGASNEYHNMF